MTILNMCVLVKLGPFFLFFDELKLKKKTLTVHAAI
jgi:hypothetical protein